MPPRKARKSAPKAPKSTPKTRSATTSKSVSATASRARTEGLAKFLREECMFREDLQGAIPSIYDVNNKEFADLDALRNAALEDDHAERVRLEYLALASFPQELRVWRITNALKLYLWLSKCNPRQFPESWTVDQQFDYLNLATTSFICVKFFDNNCLKPAVSPKSKHYPYILSHPCLQGGTQDKEFPEGRTWVPCGLMPDDGDAAIVADIVLACGLDPQKATMGDMDKLDARLVCKPCLEKNLHEADGICNWWACLDHFRAAHCGQDDPNPFAPPLPAELVKLERGEWVRLNPVAEAKAREILPALTKEQTSSWRCTLCPCSAPPTILKTWALAQSHAMMVHGQGEAVRGKQFIAQDNYAEHYDDIVYIWQLRKAGLQEYFDSRELDNFYFNKLIKVFGKIPTTFPNRPGENCAWENAARAAGIPIGH